MFIFFFLCYYSFSFERIFFLKHHYIDITWISTLNMLHVYVLCMKIYNILYEYRAIYCVIAVSFMKFDLSWKFSRFKKIPLESSDPFESGFSFFRFVLSFIAFHFLLLIILKNGKNVKKKNISKVMTIMLALFLLFFQLFSFFFSLNLRLFFNYLFNHRTVCTSYVNMFSKFCSIHGFVWFNREVNWMAKKATKLMFCMCIMDVHHDNDLIEKKKNSSSFYTCTCKHFGLLWYNRNQIWKYYISIELEWWSTNIFFFRFLFFLS